MSSRATETDLGVLQNSDGFKVYADVEGWNSLFINGDTATYNSATNHFELSQQYRWTADMKSIEFWAFHPIDSKIVNPEISAQEVFIKEFTPVASLANPGATQSDLVIAYNKAQLSDATGTAVPLKFQHALSQVEVHIANKAADDRKIVRIAGVGIVNAKNKGSLYFHPYEAGVTADNRFTIDDENGKYDIEWNLTGAVNTDYGQYLSGDNKLYLEPGKNKGTAAIGNTIGNSSLMLVPQKTTGYKFDSPNDEGSYILLLCRIEIHHEGDQHEGASEPDGVVSDGKGGHIHQLFPDLVNGQYDPDAYGYTCVPVSFDWTPGLRHIYTLNFLGASSGAGQYPPTDHPKIEPEDPDITVVEPDDPTEEGKRPGDTVLDNPISFTVTVSGWEKAPDTDTPMP